MIAIGPDLVEVRACFILVSLIKINGWKGSWLKVTNMIYVPKFSFDIVERDHMAFLIQLHQHVLDALRRENRTISNGGKLVW